MVFSCTGDNNSMSGMCRCSAVLRSMKSPADPKLISAGSTEIMSEYSIMAVKWHNGMARRRDELTTGAFLFGGTPVVIGGDRLDRSRSTIPPDIIACTHWMIAECCLVALDRWE